MSSVWNVVRAANYNYAPASENGVAGGNGDQSLTPDKFKQRITVNSLRMSMRKRIPLKRINVNGTSPDYYTPRKRKVEDAKNNEKAASSNIKVNKARGITMEASLKKTFYRVTEQLTGHSKKRQLKEASRKSTPRTRYRERLKSPPDTPSSPHNEFRNSPCSSTPLSQVKSLKRYMRNTSDGRRSTRRTPCKSTRDNFGNDCDDFSRHLELISCGIQHLEANGNKLMAAIGDASVNYKSSPLQTKLKNRGRLWKDERKSYTPMSPTALNKSSQNNVHSQPSSLASGLLRRTMTRMSLRVKTKPTLRSTKSASNIQSNCYNGPMSQGPRTLASLRAYSVSK